MRQSAIKGDIFVFRRSLMRGKRVSKQHCNELQHATVFKAIVKVQKL